MPRQGVKLSSALPVAHHVTLCDVAKEHFSFRVPARDRKLMAEQAAGRPVSELARRYVTEGLRRDRHPRVTFVPWRPGHPVLVGRPRLEVADIVETWQLSERDEEATAGYFGLPVAEVRAALAYDAEFADEIDAILNEKHRLAERYERLDRAGRPAG